ncbi:sugar dehydratase [Candidatus Woesearchaeota archaeon]|nr:sugar dehydratase [Candidatus Woesearchaeota archaeon]|tara:strand:+ start:1518 stop:2489 length:972 start_codon:yes stop_codon:yes gene_type:complete
MSKLKGKNIFVTGATGIVGYWLTSYLYDAGAEVTIYMRDFVPKSHLVKSSIFGKVNVVSGQLEDYLNIKRALNEYEIDTVFHLGAQTIVETANRSPLGTFNSNVRGTWNVLEACRNSRLVENIVVASSDKAYGTSDRLPYTEDMPLIGEHPYDVSKSCSDLIAQSYAKTYEMPIGIARCGNIYGGNDLNFNRIVPETIKSLLHNQRPIIRSDGTFKRDYIYVRDVVDSYITIAENLQKKEIKGQSFNFGNDKPLEVMEIVNTLQKLMRKENIKPKILNTAKGEIKDQYLNSKKARRLLKWKPKYTLEKGLKETIEWYKRFFKK